MIQIKTDTSIRPAVESVIDSLKNDLLEVEIVNIDSCEVEDYLYEQALLSVKDDEISLFRSMSYYQTPFLLPSVLPYTEENLKGSILFLTGKYKEARDCFHDIYLRSISEMVLLYKQGKQITKDTLRAIIDNVVEDSIYYSNMAVSQHYNNYTEENVQKLRYLYEQAIKFINNYTDELHLLKYYMLLYTQYGLFDDAKIILRHSLSINEPLAINFKSMLDTAYLSYIQKKDISLSFHDVPYYFGNQILMN